MPLPLCKGSSGSICKLMLVTGQCQPADQGWQSVRGVDQRGTGLRRRGGGFVPARERICSMRGNSISPLRERTHSHSRRVTVMPSPVYFSFHLRSHPCCAVTIMRDHLGRCLTSHNHGNTRSEITFRGWERYSAFGHQNRIWKKWYSIHPLSTLLGKYA